MPDFYWLPLRLTKSVLTDCFENNADSGLTKLGDAAPMVRCLPVSNLFRATRSLQVRLLPSILVFFFLALSSQPSQTPSMSSNLATCYKRRPLSSTGMLT